MENIKQTCYRQMNIDYSLCQALTQVKVVKKALFIYDIGCEWCQHFLDRVAAGKYLSLRDDLEVVTAIGKFHLRGYIRECFALFSLTFVQAAGQLDGQILDTLCSSLTKSAAPTGGMS